MTRNPRSAASAALAPPPKASSKGGYSVGRRRREHIITAATKQFGERGFNQTTILGISAAVGISRAGLLHHFPTKEALLAAVLEMRDEVDRERFRNSETVDPTGLRVLRTMVDLAAHNAEVPGIIALYALLAAEATAPDHPAHEYFVNRYERICEGTQRVLERVAAAGLLKPEVNPTTAATQLTSLMDGLQATWLLAPDSVDMAAQLKDAVERLLTVPLDTVHPPQR